MIDSHMIAQLFKTIIMKEFKSMMNIQLNMKKYPTKKKFGMIREINSSNSILVEVLIKISKPKVFNFSESI